MRQRSVFALICGLVLAWGLTPANAGQVQFLGRYVWESDLPNFGGLSGLETDATGTQFWTISDRGRVFEGRFARDSDGRITGIEAAKSYDMLDFKGRPIADQYHDPEGLARRADGRFYVSFEGFDGVWTYKDLSGPAAWMPRSAEFDRFRQNRSLEALALSDAGALYTLPELTRSQEGLMMYALAAGTWQLAYLLPEDRGFRPVGADFGPDGIFYLLERAFGLGGFTSQVRRFVPTPDGLRAERVLRSQRGEFDNLEGLSVWRDSAGRLRLTMVSDDNFKGFQQTEFVEYVVTE